jgi:hypothetical protein
VSGLSIVSGLAAARFSLVRLCNAALLTGPFGIILLLLLTATLLAATLLVLRVLTLSLRVLTLSLNHL